MKRSLLLAVSCIVFLSLSACSLDRRDSNDDSEWQKEKVLAIESICNNVSDSNVRDIFETRKAIARLVQLDGAYMPLLEVMASFISVSRSPDKGYPKTYPDLELLRSFCSHAEK